MKDHIVKVSQSAAHPNGFNESLDDLQDAIVFTTTRVVKIKLDFEIIDNASWKSFHRPSVVLGHW